MKSPCPSYIIIYVSLARKILNFQYNLDVFNVGIPASIIGSGPSSVSMSYGSSLLAYTGSAKSFSLSDIERATDNFSETRILGEGGFGRVYSGVLEDGTEVAVKVLKRADQQGGREFLAEVEMLSRLHHRNLVKLIGICTEEHSRCLVYELIPNGSVESHLHGSTLCKTFVAASFHAILMSSFASSS